MSFEIKPSFRQGNHPVSSQDVESQIRSQNISAGFKSDT